MNTELMEALEVIEKDKNISKTKKKKTKTNLGL